MGPKLSALILFLSIFVGFSSAGLQKYAVKGRLTCGERSASNVKVSLIDIDTGGIDDKMAEQNTDSSGNFQLEGATSELTSIDPMLKIYHNCIDDGPLTIRKRRWRFELPKKYICSGQTCRPTVLDVGTLNLEPKILAEDRNF